MLGQPPPSCLCPSPPGWCPKPKTGTWRWFQQINKTTWDKVLLWAWSLSKSVSTMCSTHSTSMLMQTQQTLTRFPGSFPWLLFHISLRSSCLPCQSDTCGAWEEHVKGTTWWSNFTHLKEKKTTTHMICPPMVDLPASGKAAHINQLTCTFHVINPFLPDVRTNLSVRFSL